MSSNLFYDSDDERDSFDVERLQIQTFQNNFLSASIESSDDDDEGIIDGTKIPSSTKTKTRARHSYLDISILSSSPSSISIQDEEKHDDDDNNEQNPFDIISKSIDLDNLKPVKKKKSLGVAKSRIILDTTDIYEQDDSNHSHDSFRKNDDDDNNDDIQSSKIKSNAKSKIRKPTKAAILETEKKMQQLSRSEHLVLPTFIPKPLETWHALEKRSRQELMNEIRAKNPSFTPQDPELPELPVVDIETTAASTLADITKLIEDKPSTSSNTLNKLSRFLNPDILKKKPTMSSMEKESTTMIDLTDTKKAPSHPTVKSTINISLDCIKSPSSNKKLFEMQKQLGIRMRAKRAAMLAENVTNTKIESDDEEEEEQEAEEIDEDSMDTTDESNDVNSEIVSIIDKENDNLQINEETRQSLSDDDEDNDEDEEQEEENEKENTNTPSDPNRPSLKTILTRLESSSEPIQPQPVEQNGQTEWFNSARPAQFDSELEMLCSGAFDGNNIIPLSQNYTRVEPMAFSPLPPTQIEEEDEEDIGVRRPKVRQLIDDDDEDDSNKQLNSGSNNVEESEDEEEVEDNEEQEEETGDNEELVDYKKQLFEMEAEESGSEVDEKEKDNDDDSDDNEEPDEELQKFIDTATVEVDEDEADSMAKVHAKIKAKEDEQQLKLLKEQYLDFDGDDDGRRIKISKARTDDGEEEDDPDYNSEIAEEEEDDEDDDENNPMNLHDRMSELERQRSIQDNQAEELHLDEDLDSIGQNSLMFKKGLVLKQKKIQNTTTSHIESTTQTTTSSTTKKTNQTRSVTLSSVLLAKRFSSTLLAPVNRNNITVANINNSNETTMTTKKQHNPRRHVFTTNTTAISTNENQNPTTSSSGEKRSNSTDKSPKTNIKRFKQSTTTTATTVTTKTKESATSVFSALALSNTRH
ncbi:unnamed protein product, partial [Adineta steineri]